MTTRTLQQIREDSHEPSYSRHVSGYSVWGRPLYTATVRCKCGWEHRSGHAGFRKADAEAEHKAHLREVEAQRVFKELTP